MRKEATLTEWKKLYEVAMRIKEQNPWEDFWDMDLIGIQEGEEEETAFISILGRGGECYGIVVYEGYAGLNDFHMLVAQNQLGITTQYAMYTQNNLTCYWGSRQELSAKQKDIIKQLGYKFRGRNQWLYFSSYCTGFSPYHFDQNEVRRMTRYLTRLEKALEYKKKHKIEVDFESANMYLFARGYARTGRECRNQSC